MLLLRGASEVVTPPETSVPLSGEAMGVVERHSNSDVLIEGNKIVAVGEKLECDADEVIDVKGKVIIPGFVDSHTETSREGYITQSTYPAKHSTT